MCMADLRVEPQALDSLNFNQLPSSEIVTAIATLDQLKRKKHLQLLEPMVIKYSAPTPNPQPADPGQKSTETALVLASKQTHAHNYTCTARERD